MGINPGNSRCTLSTLRSSARILDIGLPFSFAQLANSVAHLFLLIRKRVIAVFSTQNYSTPEAGMSEFSMRSARHEFKSGRLQISDQLADFACHNRRDSAEPVLLFNNEVLVNRYLLATPKL